MTKAINRNVYSILSTSSDYNTCCMYDRLTISIAREYWLANTNTVGAVGKVPSRKPKVAMSSCVAVTLLTPCGRRR